MGILTQVCLRMSRKLKPEDKAIILAILEEYYKGESLTKISDKLGVNAVSIMVAVRKSHSYLIDREKYDSIAQGQRSRNKLDESQVLEIYQLRIQGFETKQISDKYGVHQSTIADICRGKTFKKLFDEYSSITSLLPKISPVGHHFKEYKKEWSERNFTPEKKGVKLEKEDVESIIALFLKGNSYDEIEKKIDMKCSAFHIKRILNFHRWQRLTIFYKGKIEAEHERRRILKIEEKSQKRVQITRKQVGEHIHYPVALCPECDKPYPCQCR